MPNLPWEQARTIAHAAGQQALAPCETVRLEAALHRVLAADVIAATDIPHFAASAMDGWAVSGDGPWQLLPGEARTTPQLAEGAAVAILTGSPVPEQTTAVVRRERGRIEEIAGEAPRLHATEPLPDRADIRPAGREAEAGERLFAAGTQLTPGHLASAAVAGCDELAVRRAPRVGLVLTGDEVVAEGTPGHGLVRDAFSPVLPPAIEHLGGSPLAPVRIGDHRAATIDALGRGDVELLITTGGTGRSPADHVRPALEALDAELLIDEIAMRPGHPAVLAHRPDGVLIAGLPGNPLAALVALVTIVQPVLEGLTGRGLATLPLAAATENFPPLPGRHRLVPARVVLTPSGARLEAAAHRGPAMLRGLADSDCFLLVGPEGLTVGAPAPYLPLPWSTHATHPAFSRS